MDVSATDPVTDGAGEGPHVELDGFRGPLALLLSLARAHAIDLSRLSLADCIGQLTAVLERTGPVLPLAERADWLVMAAWLVLLWSRRLLPAASPTEEAGDNSADQPPDRERALLAARTLATWLERRPQLGIDVFARGQPEVVGTAFGLHHEVDVIEFLWACLSQFDDDADRIDTSTPYRPARHALWTVLDARARILQLLAKTSDDAPLERFLPALDAQAEPAMPPPLPLRRRSAVASTLIAGLELAREGLVTLHQPAPFAAITFCASTDADCHQLREAAA
jgi:segregation and condensation protein A